VASKAASLNKTRKVQLEERYGQRLASLGDADLISSSYRLSVKMVVVEVTRWVWKFVLAIFLLEDFLGQLQLLTVGIIIVRICPKRVCSCACMIIKFLQADFFPIICVAPGAGTCSGRNTIAETTRLLLFACCSLGIVRHRRTIPWKTVPNTSRVVRVKLGIWISTKIVAANVVAISRPRQFAARPCAQASVKSYPDAKVHPLFQERLSSFCLNLVTQNSGNSKFVFWTIDSRYYLILNVPHDACKVASVHI